MFTSVPYLLLHFSIILLIQSILLYFYEYTRIGIVPLTISTGFSLLYFLLFLFIQLRFRGNFYPLFVFSILLVFYFVELFLLIFFNLNYLWVFLVLTQILCGYYLLNNIYFFIFLSFHILLYLNYLFIYNPETFQLDSLLIVISAFLLSFLIHGERRKALINLGKIYHSQKEINNRFQQLVENIRQVFILCSHDFSEYYYISPAFERLITISRDEIMKNPSLWMKFIHSGDRERIDLEFETATNEMTYREFDFRLVQEAREIWLKFQIFPVESAESGLPGRFAIIVDIITEEKEAEFKLAEAKSLDADYAARIQRNLLFSNPILNIHQLDVAAESIPSLAVGGDFFDFYRFSDSIVDIIIADVMGKGMIASMLGAAAKSAFMKSRLDLTVQENDIPPINRILTLTVQTLSPELIQLSKFITMHYARLNMESSLFSFIDCGHTSILYYSRRLKSTWILKGWNMPIGFNHHENLIKNIVPFEEGDLFFFYSDGVTEVENEEGEMFGEKRLIYILENSYHLTSSQIMNKIRNLVFHYSSASGFADDVTCIAMKIGRLQTEKKMTEGIFAGNRDSLQIIRTFTSAFLKEHFQSVGNEERDSIILAVNEAAANIIEHNYEQDSALKDREIYIEAGKIKNAVSFHLYYDGIEFDWSAVKKPEIREMRSGGFGIHLMHEIMDSVSYSVNIDGVQCLCLLKVL